MAVFTKSSSTVIYAMFVLIILVIALIVFLTGFGDNLPQAMLIMISFVSMLALIFMLSRVINLADSIDDLNIKLEKLDEGLDKNRLVLAEIRQSVYLTEAAKNVLYRQTDERAIRQVVFDKLQKQQFDEANALIEQVSKIEQFKQLAEDLENQANKFLSAPDSERENQLIANIDKLLDEYQWTKASSQIESLIKLYPSSEKAKQMQSKLSDRKEMRKKTLLQLWDDAVKRHATDRSLEILRELDPYLTPNEGLALQEAARDAFKNKLHNMGVQFALAVSGKQWNRAMETGQQIIQEFPNSKMAEEIRERLPVLKQRVSGKS